ncbi:MAG: sugar phosphate isomerase/epimerase family protein [bacterium]
MSELRVGVIAYLGDNPQQILDHVKNMGFDNMQAGAPSKRFFDSPERENLKQMIADSGMEITTIFVGFPEEDYSTIQRIHETGGFVPKEYQEQRTEYAKCVVELAAFLGIKQIAAHIGFIPENREVPEYKDLVSRIREVGQACKNHGMTFSFETGQEKAATLAQFIQDIGLDNIRVNFDPANMILYGSGDPLEALELVGKYVGGVHGKDATWAEPEDRRGKDWGKEVPLGEGHAHWTKIIAKLKQLGYQGPITIEREISGDQQIADIKKALAFLESSW